jgi:cation diffusion facilitator family transporter
MPIRVQRFIAFLSVFLFLAKLVAWYLTHSVAILTDALESTVNVITGFIGLYSVSLAAKPRDMNHPYGHGKVEFISAAIEGSLIFIAGLVIIYEAIDQLLAPKPLQKLDYGIIITAIAGILNYAVGMYAIRQGKKLRSATIEAAGKHIRVDAYSTFAIILGLGLLLFTGWTWLDSAVALVFALVIIITGYRVVRKSLAGIMDESDEVFLNEVINFLQKHRRTQWIDMHNLRVIQFGDVMHVDAHLTLPWYYRVADGEKEIHALEDLIRDHYGNKIEIFVHIDACAPFSCKLCALPACPVRQENFKEQLVWNSANVWVDSKHGK